MAVLRAVVVLGLFCLRVVASSVAYAAADGPALVLTEPASLTLRPGETGAITIRVDNAADVYGVEFHLRFDPALVEVVDALSGQPVSVIAPGEWMKHGFAALNHANNSAGAIDYAVTLVNPSPSLTGGGPVAVITFRGKAAGAGALTIQKAIVASRQGKEIASQWENATLTVSGAAAPPAVAAAPVASPPAPAPRLRVGAPELALAAFGVVTAGALGVLVRRRR